MKNQVNKESERGFILTAVIVCFIIVVLWILTFYILHDKPNKGEFGDMFGSINSLFSGFALAGIILTILMQRKELKLQRLELQETRFEFATQNETLKLQRFENTFFSLLNLHHQIVNDIDYRYTENFGFSYNHRNNTGRDTVEVVTISGRDVFKYHYGRLSSMLANFDQSYEKTYLDMYEDVQTDFGHYFRNLYRMLKLVDQTDFFYNNIKVDQTDIFKIKYRYTCIIRSQISDYELLWLFYNCLTSNGREKFKPLIERYVFFKNIPKKLIANSDLIEKYNSTAYSL